MGIACSPPPNPHERLTPMAAAALRRRKWWRLLGPEEISVCQSHVPESLRNSGERAWSIRRGSFYEVDMGRSIDVKRVGITVDHPRRISIDDEKNQYTVSTIEAIQRWSAICCV